MPAFFANFGFRVTAGDYDGDGFGDVVFCMPGDANGAVAGAGQAYVFSGSSEGLGGPPRVLGSPNPEPDASLCAE